MYYTKNNGQPLDGDVSVISINGAEYQVGQDASSSAAGIMKLYDWVTYTDPNTGIVDIGSHTDGTMTQRAIEESISNHIQENKLHVQTVSGEKYISVVNKVATISGTADTGFVCEISSTGIDDAISTAISSWASRITDNNVIDTFKEITDWIASDESGAAKIITDIAALQSGKKDKQTAVANIAGATDATITSLTQDANGVISYTVGTIRNASASANGLMTSSDYTKLQGIAAGAEVNVQSNWNETNTASDAYIQNKPDLTVYALVSDVEDNELVVASALNDLNSRIVEANSNLADAEATAAALNDLNSRINILDETIDALWHGSDYIYTKYSLDDIHDTLGKTLDDKIMREICSKELAQPGFLVLNATIGGVSNDIYMSLDAYNKYGADGYTVIGIVVKPYDPDTNEVICMSTKYMSLANPEQGSTSPVGIMWGDATTDTSLTNYNSSWFRLPSNYLISGVINNIDKGTYWLAGTAAEKQHVSPYVSSSVIANVNLAANDPCNDTDGRSNSSVIAGITTATHTSGGTISNSSAVGNYPANDACRYYNAGGRNWYLPAMGELQFIVPRFKEINASFSKFSNSLVNRYLWSSTEYSQDTAWLLGLYELTFGGVNNNTKSYNRSVVAFAAF